jgi:hypothetical protein
LTARFIFLAAALSAVGLAAQTATPVKLPTGHPIAGIVVSSTTGQPLSGVATTITSTENRHASQTMQTGADGRFAFTSLPAGKYSLTASARGYRAQGFNQHSNFFTGIAVGPDLDGSNLTFRLVPDAAIEGIVTDDDGDAVRNAACSCSSATTTPANSAFSCSRTRPPTTAATTASDISRPALTLWRYRLARGTRNIRAGCNRHLILTMRG